MDYFYNRPESKEFRRQLRRQPTRAELCLWTHIRRKQVDGFRFRRQYGLGPYIIDFYCPSVRLAIEVDGDSHLADSEIIRDAIRTNFLNKHEIRVIRFTNQEVLYDTERVLLSIKQALVVDQDLPLPTSPCYPSSISAISTKVEKGRMGRVADAP